MINPVMCDLPILIFPVFWKWLQCYRYKSLVIKMLSLAKHQHQYYLSLLNCFENILYGRLLDQLLKNKIFSSKQMDFFKKRSAVDAIVDFMEKLFTNHCNNVKAHWRLLDLSKYLNAVDHQILRQILEIFGNRGKVLSLLKTMYKIERSVFKSKMIVREK